VLCGCVIWYIVSEKIVIIQTREIPIHLYNTHNIIDIFTCPATASIIVALSPSSLLSLPTHEIGVHIDMSILSKQSTVLTDYQTAIVLPKGIKIVHCNPIIIHKIEKNIVI
jgi:hypothetical protein